MALAEQDWVRRSDSETRIGDEIEDGKGTRALLVESATEAEASISITSPDNPKDKLTAKFNAATRGSRGPELIRRLRVLQDAMVRDNERKSIINVLRRFPPYEVWIMADDGNSTFGVEVDGSLIRVMVKQVRADFIDESLVTYSTGASPALCLELFRFAYFANTNGYSERHSLR